MATPYSDGKDQLPAYRRLSRAFVGDGMDGRTGETQVVLILHAHPAIGQPDRYHFCLPSEAARSLAKILLSGGSMDLQIH